MAISINSKGYNIGEISVSTKLEAGGQLYMDGTALKCHITAVTVS